MKTIGVIVNMDRDSDLKYTKKLIQSIKLFGGIICLLSDIAQKLGASEDDGSFKIYDIEDSIYDHSDVVICLGGDGTFLKVARKAYRTNVPILGINLGSLGFLTDIDKNDIPNFIECILSGKYEIEERMMLDTTVVRNGQEIYKDLALNDVVITRGALSRILHVRTYIDDTFVDSFPGDGLIISTPTGSTAYNLSAGGPIVEPETELMIVTPICPHILYSRSIISTCNRIVKVVVDERYGNNNAMITVDGLEGFQIMGGDCILTGKSKHTVRLVRIGSRNFFNVLRTKIYERGEKLKSNEI